MSQSPSDRCRLSTFTPEELADAVALYNEHGSQAKAAKASGMTRCAMQRRLKRAAEAGLLLDHKPAMPGFRIAEVVSDKEGNVTTVRQKPEHGDIFEMPPTHRLGKLTINRDSEGRVIQDWIRAEVDAGAKEAAMRAVVEALKEDLPRAKPVKAPRKQNALLLNQFTVTDLHFGMLAWAEETAGDDYDLKIAERLLLDWFSTAIALSPQADTAVLAQLGDLMHHDAHESVTPAHRNVLDADSRLQKIIRVVIRVIRQVIAQLLEKHRNVHVIMASANHDPASSAWLRELLHAMYEKEKRITIDNSPDIYYEYKHGDTGLFYHHGHKRNINDVAEMFAAKFRQTYGQCKHCYGHIGHYHSAETKDPPLMKVERHRTLAPADAYAASKWMPRQDAQVITYHKSFGEVSRNIISPEMVRAA